MSDSVIRRLRARLAEQDQAVLDAVNARLELVTELKRHKEEIGIPFEDPEQEQYLLERLARTNRGPLSDEAVRGLFEKILRLTKEEVDRT